MSSNLNMRKIVLDELKAANESLSKYETMLVAMKDADEELKNFVLTSITHYRQEVSGLRKHLFETKDESR